MSAESAVIDGRLLALSLMVDIGVITRPATDGTLDDAGVFTPDDPTDVHTGLCRVKMPAAVEQTLVFGDISVTRTRFVINFPHDIPAVRVDDVITITASGDPHIGERRFKVTVVPSKTFLLHRQLGVEVVE